MTSGRFRWAAAVAALSGLAILVAAPFHAVAYFNTEAGADSESAPLARLYAPALREAFPGAFAFDDAFDVYVTYGRLTSVLLAGAMIGILALYGAHAPLTTRLSRWGFGVAGAGSGLLVTGALVEYWTPYTDLAFMFLAVPGLLATIGGWIVLGVVLVKARVLPRGLAWLFAVAAPGIVPLVALLGHIPMGFFLFAVAWIWTGVLFLRQA